MTDRKTQARHVVDLLGGKTEAMRIADVPLTTIDGWLRIGWIHQKYQRQILEAAWAEGKAINELDFVVHLRGVVPPSANSERAAG